MSQKIPKIRLHLRKSFISGDWINFLSLGDFLNDAWYSPNEIEGSNRGSEIS